MDGQVAGGKGRHVLVRPVGDGGVGEGDGLGLGVALHVGRGKCHRCGLGGHRVQICKCHLEEEKKMTK